MRNALRTVVLFDCSHTLAGAYLQQTEYPFEALCAIEEWICALGEQLPVERYEKKGEALWIARSATIAPTAQICGPCIIGERTQIRHCAYIRAGVLVGDDCVVGNSTELKNSILFDGVQVPHFNYVGDSILGHLVHFGAGVIASNVRADKQDVVLHAADSDVPTGRRKVGAMVGDGSEVGCGAVLAPGCVIGKGSIVYPLCFVRGCVGTNSILKSDKSIIKRN